MFGTLQRQKNFFEKYKIRKEEEREEWSKN